MLKFNKVLLASDFDNTLVYTQGALERGEDKTAAIFRSPPVVRCPPLPAMRRICPAMRPA